MMSVNIHSTDTSLSTGNLKLSKDEIHYEPGFNYSTVMAGKEIGIPRYITLSWNFPMSLNPVTWRIHKPYIYIDHVLLESMEYDVRYDSN